MSGRFFERNKRKGLLALLLLLLSRGKAVIGLLVMVLLLAGVFILPGGLAGRIPWLSRLAGAFGLRDSAADAGRFAGMAAALRAAHERDGGFSWDGLFGGRGLGAGRDSYGRSTVDLVKGKEVFGDEAGRGPHGEPMKIRGGDTVGGVLRPEDARKRDDGVPVDMEELAAGLVRSAEAGQFAGGLPGAGMGGPSGSASLSRAGLARGSAAPGADGVLASALAASNVPPVGALASLGKSRGGKLGALKNYAVGKTLKAGSLQATRPGSNYYKLAEARAYSVVAAPPSCDTGCPKEYASTTAGAVFQGSKPGLDIMTNTAINEPPAPSLPDQGAIGNEMKVGDQYLDDAKKCQAAEDKYGPQERTLMRQFETQSCRLGVGPGSGGDTRLDTSCAGIPSLNCQDFKGGGGCSPGNKSRIKACKRLGDQMMDTCQQLNAVFRQKAAACPLTNGQANQTDCVAMHNNAY